MNEPLLTYEDWQAIADAPQLNLLFIPGALKEAVEERIRLRLSSGVASAAVTEQQRREQESAAFDAWWESSGHAADPTFTLTVQNCARAAWQARAADGVAVVSPDARQGGNE